MRIIHVVQTDNFAGVERHIAVLAKAQHAAGAHVAVVGGNSIAMRRELPVGVPWEPAHRLVQTVSGLWKWRGADIVHAHMTAAEVAATLTTLPATPLIVTRHFGQRRGQSPLGKTVAPLIRRRVAAQIAVSQYVAIRVDGPSTVVYPGVPNQPTYSTVRHPWVLAVQRLEAEKGIDVVIRAFAKSGLAAMGWRLVIVGDGSLRVEMEQFTQLLGLETSIDFLGHRNDITELMARSSLFITGCPAEGLGLAVVEAMATGLPVVATASGGHLETIGRDPAPALYPAGDTEAAGQKLRILALDDAERLQYGARLRAIQQEHFTPQRQEKLTRRVYESWIR